MMRIAWWIVDDHCSIMTGTSQAAPHVSGVVAQYLERAPYATVDAVTTHLLRTAAFGVIQNTKVEIVF